MRNPQMRKQCSVLVASAFSLTACFVLPVSAQEQSNSEQFQPSIVLPRPKAKFKGRIGTTYKDSQPDKIPIIKAPAGAPNVLIILIDDCGFGQWSTFGGQIPTPNLDKLARNGLKYT